MYNRLFTKILDSSIWLESDATRIVWITLLAAMDEDGYAPFSSPENLAHRANVPMPALEEALKILESPDRYNSDDEFQGRRIERVQGGWLVLKAPYYKGLLSREIAREQNRLRVQKHREKAKVTSTPLQEITQITGDKCNTAEQSIVQQSKAKQKSPLPPQTGGRPTREMVDAFFGESKEQADDFWDYYQSNGWRVGRNAMRDWEAAARKWKRNNNHSEPKMSPQHRQKRINYLNEKKQTTMRMIKDPNNPPSWAEKELAAIDDELKLL